MKKSSNRQHELAAILTITGLAYVVLFTIFAGICLAAGDHIVTGTLKSVAVAQDKNGRDYVRLVIPEQKQLNGVKYEEEVLIFAFGNTIERARTLKAGDKVSMIVNTSQRNGYDNHRLIAFAK